MKEYNQLSYEYLNQARENSVPHPYNENTLWQRNFRYLTRWINDNQLESAKVLEVGGGSGRLQHLVTDYTALDLGDLSRFFQKPFVQASATCMPFADNTFDAAWSIWVLEHIPQPEQMLAEMRRVIKPGGTLFLCVAYSVDTWISRGLHKRQYRDLSATEKVEKLSIFFRRKSWFKAIHRLSYRVCDLIKYIVHPEPTTIRYKSLQPNFEIYWDWDADACVSIDAYSVAMYFLSRGDQSLCPAGLLRSLIHKSEPLVFRINKNAIGAK